MAARMLVCCVSIVADNLIPKLKLTLFISYHSANFQYKHFHLKLQHSSLKTACKSLLHKNRVLL